MRSQTEDLFINFRDIKGNKLNIDSIKSIKYINFFFMNDFNCHECIYKTLNALDSILNQKTIIVVGTENSIIRKKSFLSRYKNEFNNRMIYFESSKKNNIWPPEYESGAFNEFNVTKTPHLVFYNISNKIFINLGSTSIEGNLDKAISNINKLTNYGEK